MFRQFWLTMTFDPRFPGHSGLDGADADRREAEVRTLAGVLGTPIPASKEANPDRIRRWMWFSPVRDRPRAVALACWARPVTGVTTRAMAATAATTSSNRGFTVSSSARS